MTVLPEAVDLEDVDGQERQTNSQPKPPLNQSVGRGDEFMPPKGDKQEQHACGVDRGVFQGFVDVVCHGSSLSKVGYTSLSTITFGDEMLLVMLPPKATLTRTLAMLAVTAPPEVIEAVAPAPAR